MKSNYILSNSLGIVQNKTLVLNKFKYNYQNRKKYSIFLILFSSKTFFEFSLRFDQSNFSKGNNYQIKNGIHKDNN